MFMQSKIDELRMRSGEARDQVHQRIPHVLHAKTRQEATSPQKIMVDALDREFRGLGENSKQQIARELVLMPHGRKVKVGGEVLDVEDLQYRIAESLDIYNAGTSRKYEYHEYINDAAKIISDMNTNGVTVDELNSRNDFITDTIQRENEIMTSLALYKASGFKGAQEKYAELYTRLQKIREVRAAVLSSTNSVADKVNEQEQVIENEKAKAEAQKEQEKKEIKVSPNLAEKAAMSTMIFALLNYDKLTDSKKMELGIYNGNLENEVSPEKTYAWLANSANGVSLMERKVLDRHRDEDEMAKHILALSGVRSQKYGNQNVVERRYQEFDQSRFNDILLRRKLEEERLRA